VLETGLKAILACAWITLRLRLLVSLFQFIKSKRTRMPLTRSIKRKISKKENTKIRL